MKKIFNTILVCFLIAVSFFTTGCFYVPGISGDNTGSLLYPYGTIAGYKVCYKPAQYQFEELFWTFSENIMSELYDYFTFDGINEISNIDSSNYIYIWENNALKLDRIRYQPKFVDDGRYYSYDNVSWNWTFGRQIYQFETYLLNNEKIEKNEANIRNIITYYQGLLRSVFDNITSIYSIVLEYNIYELVLGRTPTAPVIVVHDDQIPTVSINGIEIIVSGDTTNRTEIITPIQEEFSQYGTYVGFTERDRENLTNYILETVIGDQIVNNSNYNKNNEYQTKVAEIVYNSNPTASSSDDSIRDFFDPYPASKIKDFNGTAFYINGGVDENGNSANNAFDHIQSAEYQSFVIMPEQEDLTLCALWLAFESEQPIDAVIRVRYYDGAGRLFETARQPISMSGDPFNAVSDIIMVDLVYSEITDTELDTSVDMSLDIFDNSLDNGILEADEIDGKYVTGELANYYNIIESESGFGAIGVLNHNRIPFSYMEIVIDVIKDPNQPQATYPFKMGVVGIFPTAE